jgi:hypothetical protein
MEGQELGIDDPLARKAIKKQFIKHLFLFPRLGQQFGSIGSGCKTRNVTTESENKQLQIKTGMCCKVA